MFYHVKDLQFNARVSKPDPRFANLLLQQFGGPNGELKAAMQYFIQAFGAKEPYPDKYDMLMDIATEEFSHLEIVGATIQMLLSGVNGKLKDAADESEIMQIMGGKAAKENVIHEAMSNPHFLLESAGGPILTDSRGIPWSGTYVNANGDLTVDLRSNMGAESRAKIVYEYLMKFTDDPYVKETLKFLMTREVAHFQMFEAALETIQPNFPPGVLQADPRHSNTYFNMSTGAGFKGPWNEGESSKLGETWQFIEDPIAHVEATNGLIDQEIAGTDRTEALIAKINKDLSEERSQEVKEATTEGENQWSEYALSGDAKENSKSSGTRERRQRTATKRGKK
ncbi:manganese catalase family protein [Pseudochryseolinea flava]|uniref:Manganese catalase family protein n=1 Tax=Pseudochryseolinea flava TaxID=2059302 RepID=A0A364Y0Q5_9BACT|nr:manganese catalase family protein [Pseudochryseolinea flava]RAW00178.1 manganese catalase family protein [Pseudochryseolinea flava]